VLTPDDTQLYIGTPHSYYSIYADEAREELAEAQPFLASFARPQHSPWSTGSLSGIWARPLRRPR